MTMLLSVALLLVGTTATLAAFGGKTWRDGPEPIIERISSRGWVSLVCLVLAFCLGIFKEFKSASEEAEKSVREAVTSAVAKSRQEDLLDQLKASKEAELDAQRSLNDLRGYAASTETHLRKTQGSLDDVRGDLVQTRAQLNQQSATNMITALSSTNLAVKDVVVYIPNTPEAGIAHSVLETLSPKPKGTDCFGDVSLAVHVELPYSGPPLNHEPPEQDHRLKLYQSDDHATRHEYLSQRYSDVDQLDSTSSFWYDFVFEEYRDLHKLEYRFKNGIIYNPQAYQLHIKVPPGKYSASEVAAFYKQASVPVWAFATSHKPNLPNACYVNFRRYYKQALDRAVIAFIFDDPKKEALLYHLTLIVDTNQHRGIFDQSFAFYFGFEVNGSPELITNWVGNDIDEDWPTAVVGK